MDQYSGTQAPPPMSSQQTALYNEAWQTANNLHQGGVPAAAIYEIVVKKGVDPATAQQMVDNVSKMKINPGKAEGRRDMLIGGLWIAGGLVITIGTYMAAQGGGRYLITYGPIIYGVIRFFKGVSKL